MNCRSSPKEVRILFLDDSGARARRFTEVCPQAVWVTGSRECIRLLSQDWDEVWLDHDLGGEVFVDSRREDCGMEVVRHMAANRPEHLLRTRFVVHSLNFAAARRMVRELRRAGYECIHRPFPYTEEGMADDWWDC